MISVVLVNWNGWADTIECIQSLLNSVPVPARIIVVDNASANESVEIFRCWSQGGLSLVKGAGVFEKYALAHQASVPTAYFVDFDEKALHFDWDKKNLPIAEKEFSSIYFVRSRVNGGFGYGCNVGMRLAQQLGTDGIWLLNNDCVVSPDALNKLHRHIFKHPDEIVGAVLKYYRAPDVIQAIGGGKLSRFTGKFALQADRSFDGKLDYIHGASMAFSINCLERVGFFDQKMFMYCEDVDYCLRAALLGYRFSVLPVDVFHKEGASQGNLPSVNAWVHVLVNKHYVLKKNFGWGPWVVFYFAMLIARSVLPVGQRVARQGARRALAYFAWGKEI